MALSSEAVVAAILANIGDPRDAEAQANRIQVPVSLSNRTLNLLTKKYGYLGAALAKKHMIAFINRLKKAMEMDKAASKTASMPVKEGLEGVAPSEISPIGEQPAQFTAVKFDSRTFTLIVKCTCGNTQETRVDYNEYPNGRPWPLRCEKCGSRSLLPTAQAVEQVAGDIEYEPGISDQSIRDRLGIGESQYKHPTGSLLRRQSSFRSSLGKTKSFGGVVDQQKGKKKPTLEGRLDAAFEAITEGDMAIRAPGVVFDHESGELIVDDNVVVENSHADLLKLLVSWLMSNNPEIFKKAVEEIANGVRTGQYIR